MQSGPGHSITIRAGPAKSLTSAPGTLNSSALAGVVAQLVERLNGIQEVRGSNPLGSTILRPEPTFGGSERRMVSSAALAKEDFLRPEFRATDGRPSPRFHAMFYTYIIVSISHPEHRYIGHTSDLKQRLADHNTGRCDHTAKFAPWKLKIYTAFERLEPAQQFERYLKSGSGHAFANRHFFQNQPSQESPPSLGTASVSLGGVVVNSLKASQVSAQGCKPRRAKQSRAWAPIIPAATQSGL